MSEGAFTMISILFALAVCGLSDWIHIRDTYRANVRLEWEVREAWMRDFTNNEEFIDRARRIFFKKHGISSTLLLVCW